MSVSKTIRVCLVLMSICASYPAMSAEDDSWLVGKWELSYDPDGAKKDWLEFLPNGDAWSIGANGKIQGMYIVDEDTVKAVFTWKKKDFIMTFHADRQNNLLKIVTSHTGKESIYKKMDKP
jgi:hypothetical protein